MFCNLAAGAAYVLAAVSVVRAQTSTKCNPLEKSDCPVRPGFTGEYFVDFRKGPDGAWKNTAFPVTFGPHGAEFNIQHAGESYTYASDKHLLFGRVEVRMKAAPGRGIVSAVVLQSDVLDEIDWEMIGSDTTRVQSNYFGKGFTGKYDRGGFHDVKTPAEKFHTYAVDWTKDSIQWIIDGKTVRTLKYADAAKGTQYPQTPAQIRIGNWQGGAPENAPGTIAWAGGPVDLSKAPFKMYVEWVRVKPYMPAAAYEYGDKSGSWQSVKLLNKFVPPPDGNKVPPNKSGKPVASPDDTCGPERGFTCIGAQGGSCCSPFGFCGSTPAHCGNGCQDKFGTCGVAKGNDQISPPKPS